MIFSAHSAWEERQIPGGEEGDYDRADMELLLETREVMLTTLEDPAYSVREALALGLLYGYHTQNRLDGGEETAFDPVAELEFARGFAKEAPQKLLTEFYLGLEILTSQWETMLRSSRGEGVWDDKLRRLAAYGVQRYWLQAISDFDLVGRVKMILISCLVIRTLGGQLMQTAQLYSKEIENSIDNVEALLDGAYQERAFTDDRLLGHFLL